MDVITIPFDPKYLAETLAMMRKWSPDHPELGEKSLYDWQRCSRYLALVARSGYDPETRTASFAATRSRFETQTAWFRTACSGSNTSSAPESPSGATPATA